MKLRDLKAPMLVFATPLGGVALMLWGLVWGLLLLLTHRPVGSFLGVAGYLVFILACLASVFAGASLITLSVLAASDVDEEGDGWRSRFLRVWRRVGPHVLGLAVCTVAAVLMSAAMTVWPLRLVHVDIVASRAFVLRVVGATEGADSAGRVRSVATMPSTVTLLNLALVFGAFELAMFLRRTSLFRRKSYLGTKAAVLVVVCLVFLPFICYPKVKGFVKARRFRRNPSATVLRYIADLSGNRGLLISTAQPGEPPPLEGIFSWDNEKMKRFTVSEGKMSELIDILADRGFFEMEACLYPYGTSGGNWELIEITDGTHRHEVSFWSGEPEGTEFEALRDRVTDWLGVERVWEERP